MNILKTSSNVDYYAKKYSISHTVLPQFKLLYRICKDPNKIIAVIFTGLIFFFGMSTLLPNLKIIGYETLIGYKSNLPVNANVGDHINGMLKSMESTFNKSIYGENTFAIVHGALQKLLAKKIVEDANPDNTVVKDAHGKLYFVNGKTDINAYANSILKLNAYLDKSDTGLLYIQAPFKVLDGYTKLPAGIKDCTNQTADDFIGRLAENNIDYLDLRQEIVHDNLDKSKLFFNTDHHWRIEAAYWGFTKTVDKLNSFYHFGIDSSFTDINNYESKQFENVFLGSQGKRVGRFYGGIDDFNLLTPSFSTDFNISIRNNSGKAKEFSGNFYQTLIKDEYLDPSKSIYNNWYCAYLGGDHPLINIENKAAKCSKKILLLKDSFADALAPFLALAVSRLDVIDLRYYKEQTLKEYLNKNSYDLVLFLYNPGAYYGNSELFEFGLR